jgi:hypothetical protein
MTEPLYEMWWDCAQCGAKGLLGVSHRHCPQCGAAQDPAARYFPEPGKEVEAKHHRFVGVDWLCTYCESPNSAAAAFCVNCGGPKDGAKAVKLVTDGPEPASPPAVAAASQVPPPPPVRPGFAQQPEVAPRRDPAGSLRWLWVAMGLVLTILVVLTYQFFSKHDETVQLADKSWTREVDVERFTSQATSAWCDAMPGDAYQVTRSREQRGSKQVPDGQDCHTVRVDGGDGSFTKRQECSPRYRDEPVYDTRCHYRVNRWQILRTDKLAGNASLVPAWPQPLPGHRQGVAGPPAGGMGLSGGAALLGADRLGSKRERYQVYAAISQRQAVVLHTQRRPLDCLG